MAERSQLGAAQVKLREIYEPTRCCRLCHCCRVTRDVLMDESRDASVQMQARKHSSAPSCQGHEIQEKLDLAEEQLTLTRRNPIQDEKRREIARKVVH